MNTSYLLLVISIVLSIAAQFMMKAGSKVLSTLDANAALIEKIKVAILNVPLLAAITLYGFSFVIYFIAVSKLELSKAYPILSVSAIVFITIGSIVFLNESVNLAKVIGILLCIAGIVLIFWKS